LVNADPAWLKRIVRGQRMASFGLMLSILGGIASLLLMFLGGLIVAWLGLDWEGPAARIFRDALVISTVFGGLLIAAIGFFLVTSLDPRETGRELPTSQRVLARWGMVVAIALLVLGELDALETSPTLLMVGTMLSLLGLAALAVAIPAMLFWLAGLAARIPARDLASRTSDLARMVRRRLLIFVGLGVVDRCVTLVPAGTQARDVADVIDTLAGCGATIVMLALLFNLLALFATMSTLAKAFAKLAPGVTPADAGPGPAS
jgi:MFS family permease